MSDRRELSSEIKGVGRGEVVLVESEDTRSFEIGVGVVKALTDYKNFVAVLSSIKPCNIVLGVYEQNKMAVKKIFIIDVVCRNAKAGAPDVVHLDPADLTGISIVLTDFIETVGGKKCVIFDSLSTWLVYNNQTVFTRFIHSLITKLRVAEVGCVMVTIKGSLSQEFRAEVAQLCDRVVKA